jgi:hypothetical protein
MAAVGVNHLAGVDHTNTVGTEEEVIDPAHPCAGKLSVGEVAVEVNVKSDTFGNKADRKDLGQLCLEAIEQIHDFLRVVLFAARSTAGPVSDALGFDARHSNVLSTEIVQAQS